MEQICVGLFGTCAGSRWRDAYREWAERTDGVEVFDPQVMPETHGRSWCEADIENELRHLKNDPVLMFKVTGETTGLTSFQEILATIVESVRAPKQFIVIIIEPLGINFKDHQDDPRLHAIRDMLQEANPNFKFSDPFKDAHRCREWMMQYLDQLDTPMINIVASDEEAMPLLTAAAQFARCRPGKMVTA